MDKKYWHELSSQEIVNLYNKGLTWGQVAEMHPQPDWCEYPDAVSGEMGCWSLILQSIKSESDCLGCELRTKKIIIAVQPELSEEQ